MQMMTDASRALECAPGKVRQLNVVIIHDDFGNGRWGLLFLERFAGLHGRVVEFIPRLCKIEELLCSQSHDLFDRKPDEVQIVIIAVYEETVLPPPIEKWVGGCNRKGLDSGGVRVVLKTTPSQVNTGFQALNSILRDAGRLICPGTFTGRAGRRRGPRADGNLRNPGDSMGEEAQNDEP